MKNRSSARDETYNFLLKHSLFQIAQDYVTIIQHIISNYIALHCTTLPYIKIELTIATTATKKNTATKLAEVYSS